MQRTTKQRIQVPADILTWPIGYTSRKVYIALLVFQLRARQHQSQRILKTYEEIAALSGIANVKTVAACVRELAAAGYIEIKPQMYWSEDCKKLYRGTNEYTILPLPALGSGYFLLPVKLLTARITPAAFTVLLFLFQKQGRNTRSWPSLRRGFQAISQKNGQPMPRKTICDALSQLRRCLMLIVLHCLKRNNAFSMNTYMLTIEGDWTASSSNKKTTLAAGAAELEGGYFFGGLPVKSKITKSFKNREKKKGVDYLVHFTEKLRKIAKLLKTALLPVSYLQTPDCTHRGSIPFHQRRSPPMTAVSAFPGGHTVPVIKTKIIISLSAKQGARPGPSARAAGPGGAAPPRTR